MVLILQIQKLRLREVKPLDTHTEPGSNPSYVPMRPGLFPLYFLPLGTPQIPRYKAPKVGGRCFYPLGAKGGALFLAPERPLSSP